MGYFNFDAGGLRGAGWLALEPGAQISQVREKPIDAHQ
jgi:hypothetical protein